MHDVTRYNAHNRYIIEFLIRCLRYVCLSIKIQFRREVCNLIDLRGESNFYLELKF